MRIVTLMENNTQDPRFCSEHGLSLYIETGKYKILFDAGQSSLFADNARMLGVDLGEVDFAVLSHGHYDHSGGLRHFMRINKKALVYVNRHAFQPHYNGAGKYIGVDPEGLDLSRIRYVDDEFEIDQGITLYSCNDRRTVVPADPFGQTVLEGDQYLPDDYRHEQYLLINENGKKICFSGCSHKGILNIAHWFQPDYLIGGFHFMKIPTTEEGKTVLLDAARVLLQGKTRYITGHCTGSAQYAVMEEVLKDRLQILFCGMEIEID